MLDFDSINASAKNALPSLVLEWLPQGVRRGREWVVGDLRGNPGDSLSINVETGLWMDFATGESGSDPISLFAAINGFSQFNSAKALAEKLGIETKKQGNGKSHPKGEPQSEIIFPVPRSAPPPIDHYRLGKPNSRWAYRDAMGALLGYISRFDLGQGKKEVLPQVFTAKGWRWLSFDKPRWLYGLDELALRPEDDVLIVEGEKCADAARKLLPGYVSITWPGGGKAAALADWSPIYGRNVLIWPDRDRHQYPTDHPEAGGDIPYNDQPGTLTAEGIAKILEDHCPKILVLDVSEFTKDGHDVADCLSEGWTPEQTLSWCKAHVSPRGKGFVSPIQSLYVPKRRKPIPTTNRYNISIKDFISTVEWFVANSFSGIKGPLRHFSGTWYRWNGAYYVPVSTDLLRHEAYLFLDKCAYRDASGVNFDFKPDRDFVSKLLDALAAHCHLADTFKAPCWISGTGPNPKDCVVLQNGILELSTRKLWPHSTEMWTLNCMPYSYDPSLPPPKEWLSFLDSQWAPDPESTACLQEICGYLLTSDTSFQKIFMLIGPKRAGKGTIARVLKELLGVVNTIEPTLDNLRNEFGLEQLIGKMLAVFSDVRLEGQTANIVEHLLSISGEDSKSVNRKNRIHWNGKLNTRFFLMSNLLPRFSDSSGALASRFVILHMRRSHYGKEDTKLTEKLLPELSGIFNWALDGLDRLRKRGFFVSPKSSMDKIKEFEELSAPIGAFLRDRCEMGDNLKIECTELFSMWNTWCREQGRDGIGTLQTFSRDLKAQDANVMTKTLRGWNGVRHHFVGVGRAKDDNLKEDVESAPPQWVTEQIWQDEFSLADD